jgi:hypothetical protein
MLPNTKMLKGLDRSDDGRPQMQVIAMSGAGDNTAADARAVIILGHYSCSGGLSIDPTGNGSGKAISLTPHLHRWPAGSDGDEYSEDSCGVKNGKYRSKTHYCQESSFALY